MCVLFFSYLLSFGLAFGVFRGFVEEVHSLPHDVEAKVTHTGVDVKQVFVSYCYHFGFGLIVDTKTYYQSGTEYL